MNGISPFNYRKLTPEQERRGQKVVTIMSLIAIAAILALAVWGYMQ